MEEIQKAIDDAVGPKWRKVVTVIAVLVVMYIVSGLIFGLWPFSVARDMAQKTVNADSIIQNYQWYYDQYNAIQAQKANIDDMPKDAPERAGMTMVLNNSIAEYNSRSKQITRNLWKAKDLPYQIDFGGSK